MIRNLENQLRSYKTWSFTKGYFLTEPGLNKELMNIRLNSYKLGRLFVSGGLISHLGYEMIYAKMRIDNYSMSQYHLWTWPIIMSLGIFVFILDILKKGVLITLVNHYLQYFIYQVGMLVSFTYMVLTFYRMDYSERQYEFFRHFIFWTMEDSFFFLLMYTYHNVYVILGVVILKLSLLIFIVLEFKVAFLDFFPTLIVLIVMPCFVYFMKYESQYYDIELFLKKNVSDLASDYYLELFNNFNFSVASFQAEIKDVKFEKNRVVRKMLMPVRNYNLVFSNRSYFKKFHDNSIDLRDWDNPLLIKQKSHILQSDMNLMRSDSAKFSLRDLINESGNNLLEEIKDRLADSMTKNKSSPSLTTFRVLDGGKIQSNRSKIPKIFQFNKLQFLGYFSLNYAKKTRPRFKGSVDEVKKLTLEIFIYVSRKNPSMETIDLLLYDISDLKLAEKKNVEAKLKENLFSKIAHEFKTPLIIMNSHFSQLYALLNPNGNSFDTGTAMLYSNIRSLSDYTIFLIDDLICYSNNTKEIALNVERNVALRDILEFCFCIMNTLISLGTGSKENIRTEFEYDNDIDKYVRLNTDTNRLKQIILNLINNSIKFTKSGFIKIKAKLDYNKVIIDINDSGIGMDEQKMKKIIHNFNISKPRFMSTQSKSVRFENQLNEPSPSESRIEYTVDNVANTVIDGEALSMNIDKNYHEFNGLGLGLSIVKFLCEKMDIVVDCRSNVRRGTTFSICLDAIPTEDIITEKVYLPCRDIDIRDSRELIHSSVDLSISRNLQTPMIKNNQENPDEIEHEELHTNREVIPITSHLKINSDNISKSDGRATILVCDDSWIIRNSLKGLLNGIEDISQKFIVETAFDGIDLVSRVINDQLKENRIKIVISDENMEFLNGSDAVIMLRVLESQGKISKGIYFSTTAFSNEEIHRKIESAGFDDVLMKPITRDMLEELFRKHKII